MLLISEELQKADCRGISDLEIYKKAIHYYVPDGDIQAQISVTFEENIVEDCIDGAHPSETIVFNKPVSKPKKKKMPENIRKEKKHQTNEAPETSTVQASLFDLL